MAADNRTEEERIQDQTDAVAEDIPEIEIVPPPKERVKRQKRPQNWEAIAIEAQIYGNRQALRNYPAELLGTSETASYQILNL